jgi:hypothetical protein
MAALVFIFSSSASFAAGSCQDWKGLWQFSYSNATSTQICVDNESVTSSAALDFCLSGSAGCKCFDNASYSTRELICFKNASSVISVCDNASKSGCFCAKNPLYRQPTVSNGVYEVVISQVNDNATQGSQKFMCLATGKRGSQDITIAQPDAATLTALEAYYPNAFYTPASGDYLYFEGPASALATLPFATIKEPSFDGVNFDAETGPLYYNQLGLTAGLKCIDKDGDGYGENCPTGPDCDDNNTYVHDTCDCVVNVIPKTVYRLFTFFIPFSYYVIGSANSDIELEYPISLDFLPAEGMSDIILIKIGPRLIFGILLFNPAMLLNIDYEVILRYGDMNGDMNQCTGQIRVL